MGPVELNFQFDPRRKVRLGILALALLLVFFSLFAGWWTMNQEFRTGSGGSEKTQRASPFDSGYFSDVGTFDDEGLDTEVQVTGWLMVVATLAALGMLGMEVAAAGGIVLSARHQLIPAAVTAATSLLAVLYTAFFWPSGWGTGLGFFHTLRTRPDAGFQETTSYYAGMGWYLAILGGIVIPVGLHLYTRYFAPPETPRKAEDPAPKQPERAKPEPTRTATPAPVGGTVLTPPPPPPYMPPPSNIPTYSPARAPTIDTVPTRRAPIQRKKE